MNQSKEIVINIRLNRGTVRKALLFSVLFGALAAPTWIFASQVGSLTSFVGGTPIVAAEVNGNFSTIRTSVNDNDGRISSLEAQIAALQSSVAANTTNIATVQSNSVLALDGILTLDTHNGFDRALFTGVNVQVINGIDQTTPDGTGNLIVGYNYEQFQGENCSLGDYDNEVDCVNNGATWATSHKTGSHNIVGGERANYSQTGGLIVGYNNVINQHGSVVAGGQNNLASGIRSSVTGGMYNVASGNWSWVGGGGGSSNGNIASGPSSSVSGGYLNEAFGSYSSVCGGYSNTASAMWSSVSGGGNNTASNNWDTVVGDANHVYVDTTPIH